MSHRVHRLLTTLFSTPIKDWNGQKGPLCLSLFICLCWFISLCGAALFASSLLDSLPPLGIEWPWCPSSKYTPIFTWRSVCLKSVLFGEKPFRLWGNWISVQWDGALVNFVITEMEMINGKFAHTTDRFDNVPIERWVKTAPGIWGGDLVLLDIENHSVLLV